MIDYSSEFDRNLLRGIMRYSKENGPWSFYRISADSGTGDERCREVIRIAKKWKADAIIGRWNDRELASLDNLHVPIVLQNYHHRSTIYSNITGDYKGTGAMAADFFYGRRYSNFAFFGIKGVVWSDERLAGYREKILSMGCFFSYYEMTDAASMDRSRIASWLKTLPQGTALFCCDDERALTITEICRAEGIDIPGELSVLGVDNDDLICCISDPQISSVQLDVEQGGYMLCKCLHKQILNPDSGQFSIVINPIAIKERNSTTFHISDQNVLRLVQYINAHYTQDLTIANLLEDVPLSRRSIESKFKKVMGMGIYQYVLDCRISRVAQLLVTTGRSLSDIASEAGIQDNNSLTKLFKKKMNCTPIEYRRKFCAFSS